MEKDMLVFTPSAVLALLSEIEELKDLNLEIDEVGDGEVHITVGENGYILKAESDSTVEVDEEVVDTIDEINEEGYNELDVELVDIEGDEPVEGGIIKELIKTLAVGGLVRLTKDAIMKS